MPGRLSRLNRTWALLWAVLQFALPAAASIADAGIERGSLTLGAHIEETSSSACPQAHSADCAVCQFLSHGSTLAQRAAVPELATAPAAAPIGSRLTPPAEAFALAPPARAPPVA